MTNGNEFDAIHGIIVPIIYLLSAVLFILGLKRMSRIITARGGNRLAAFAMLLAVIGTLLDIGLVDYKWIITGLIIGGAIGAVAAIKVKNDCHA